mgnify:CR=1 FL=1
MLMACSDVQSLLRKFRSQLTVTPAPVSCTLGSLACGLQTLGCLWTQCGCDAAPMEPVGSLEYLVEVEVARFGFADTAVCAVVDDLAWSHAGARLQEVDAQTLAASCDEFGVYAEFAQAVDCCCTYLMCGNFAHEVSFVSIVCQAHGHIGFAPSIVDTERVRLHNAVVPRGRESKHDFAQAYNLTHIGFLVFS